MIRRCDGGDTEKILRYVRPHVGECMYLYIDIKKYGLDDEFIKAWMDEKDGECSLAMMKYHTGIVLYTDDPDWDVDAVTEIIREEEPLSITARRDLAEALHERIKDRYDDYYGYIYILTDLPPVEIDLPIEKAGPEDCLEIAELVVIDESVGSHYDVEDYASQLRERMMDNFGRSYIIRKDGRIIGHIASYAECDGIAPVSGLIVHPDHRNGMYGVAIERKIMMDLMAEGFTVYSTVTTRLRKRLMTITGNRCAGEYGKLVMRSGI